MGLVWYRQLSTYQESVSEDCFFLQAGFKKEDARWRVVNQKHEERTVVPHELRAEAFLSPGAGQYALDANSYFPAEMTLDAALAEMKLVKAERLLTHLKERYQVCVLQKGALLKFKDFQEDVDILNVIAGMAIVCPKKLPVLQLHAFIQDNAEALPLLARLNKYGAVISIVEKGM